MACPVCPKPARQFLVMWAVASLVFLTLVVSTVITYHVLLIPSYDIFKYALQRFYAAALEAANGKTYFISFGLCCGVWALVASEWQHIMEFLEMTPGKNEKVASLPQAGLRTASRAQMGGNGTVSEAAIKDLERRVKYPEAISIRKAPRSWT